MVAPPDQTLKTGDLDLDMGVQMTARSVLLAVVLTLALFPATTARAQEQTPGATDAVSLSVDVTISRYQGEELTGSRPYTLSVIAGGGLATLGLDDRVPVPAGPLSAGPDGVSRPVGFTNEMVGTLIECIARSRGDGRYEVSVEVQESFVVGADRTSTDVAAVPYPPVFRSFHSNNALVLRDGQSQQYMAAADPVTGETIRVDVTLTVLE